jgi:glutathione S-transferase
VITLYGFGKIFKEGHGETKDMRVQWALEELGLPYRVHALDHTGGELDGEAYRRINPFRQAPALDDDGLILTESGAILLHLAGKAGKLIGASSVDREHVTQWCFVATATIGAILQCVDLVGIFDPEDKVLEKHARGLAERFLGGLEERLNGRDWTACSEFTVADIAMANALRSIRKSDVLEAFPRAKAYSVRCHARLAWQRTLQLTADRLGVPVDDIR